MNKIKYFIIFFFFAFGYIRAYEKDISTNKQILDSIFNSFFSKNAILLKTKKITQIGVSEIDQFSYFQNKFINELVSNDIKVDNNSAITIKLNFDEFEIQYLESKDELTRVININVNLFLIDKNGQINLLDKLNTTYKDQIKAEDISAIENNLFPFTKGKIPKPRKSLFDEIIEPIVVVSAAVLTVVLFFSVRTK